MACFYGDDDVDCPPRVTTPPDNSLLKEDAIQILAWKSMLEDYAELDRQLRMVVGMLTTDDFLGVKDEANVL